MDEHQVDRLHSRLDSLREDASAHYQDWIEQAAILAGENFDGLSKAEKAALVVQMAGHLSLSFSLGRIEEMLTVINETLEERGD